MSRRGWLLGLLGALAIGGGIWLFLFFFERVHSTVTLPPEGEARYNALYALRAALQAQGVPAQTYPVLSLQTMKLGPRDTVLLYTRPEAISEQQAAQLKQWVRGGGHLVTEGPPFGETPGALMDTFGLQAAKPPRRAADEDPEDEDDGGEDAEEGDFAAYQCVALSATPPPPRRPGSGKARANADADADADADAGKGKRKGPGREMLNLCGMAFTSDLPQFQGHHGDSRRGYLFGRLDDGQGVVTVSWNLGFLDNDSLRRRIATDLAYQVLAPRLGEGKVHLVYSADVPSLWRLMLMHGWMALLPAALALAAFLWMRGQRFGPRVPLPSPNRRALLEHVQAAGEFAFRRGRTLALHAAVLSLFQRRLALRDPVLAALDGEALVAGLAERFNLPPERVRNALRPVGLQRPDVFLHAMSTLVLMRNRL